jgi:hypothetical protein
LCGNGSIGGGVACWPICARGADSGRGRAAAGRTRSGKTHETGTAP